MRARSVAAGIGLLAAVAGASFAVGAGHRPAPSAAAISTATAPVIRGNVTQRVEISGTLGYDGSYRVLSYLPAGILTWVPGPGTLVSRGHRLFSVSGTSAVLLYGKLPAYRPFAFGMSDGPDVRELERNLTALGWPPGPVDTHFSWATSAAIWNWQAARGLPAAMRTGTLRLGEVVFLPSALRVTQDTASPGASAGPGTPVLSGTSDTQVVTAQVGADQRYLLKAGDGVLVRLPSGGKPVPGRIIQIGRQASAAAGGSGPVTLPVTIALPLPRGSDLDQAPVQVAITVNVHRGVLLVPVTALLAKPGGGYQVRVVDGHAKRPVDVTPGLYDDAAGTVEVSGAGLAEGTRVEVPAT